MRFNDDLIKKTPRPTSGQKPVWDSYLEDFGVRLTPTKHAFVIRYRRAGKRCLDTLKGFDNRTVAEAREEARRVLHEVGATIEQTERLPACMNRWAQLEATRWRPRYASKVQQIIDVWFAGEPLSRGKKTEAEQAAIEVIAAKPPATVTREDMVTLFDTMRAAGRRGQADQVLAIGSSFFTWGIDRKLGIKGNPCRGRLRLSGGRIKRDRTLNDAELLAIWRAFEAEGYPPFDAFRLLVFTGARRREVTKAKWQEFDLDKGLWVIPGSRTKNKCDHKVALVPPVLALLKSLPRFAGNDHVFVGQKFGGAFDFQREHMKRVRARAGVANWRLHDFRRTMRTGMSALGVLREVSERCLNHLPAALVQVYDRHEYQVEATQAWAATARAEAQCVRLALLYALLDRQPMIDLPHLQAALALWRYCEQSARYVFGSALGDRVADELLRVLRNAGAPGMTRNELRDHFARNQSSERIGAALALLQGRGWAYHERQATAGRPREVWKAAATKGQP